MSPSTPATVVSAATPSGAAPPVAAPAEDVAALKARIAALEGETTTLKTTNTEHQRNAQFWYEKARGGATVDPPKPKEEPDAEVDLLELITTQGTKGLTAYLKKQGLATRDQVESLVNTRAAQLTTEQQLLTQYPELGDKKSEFFQTTAGHYGELKKEGVPEATAMRLAAQMTEMDGIQAGTIKTKAQRTADEKAEREADRRARANAQAGDRGGRTPQAAEEDDTLDADEEAACKNLADALEIPIEKARERYIARAKAGVNTSLGVNLDRRRR
jgi:hypothetical protein